MNTQERLPITRKVAIYQAILLLEKQDNQSEEIVILKELATGVPILQWSQRIAKDCIDNFYLENNRLPTVTDLEKSDGRLPAHSNFKYIFGITASQWLKKYSQEFKPPKTTRKQALLTAFNILKGEEQQRIKEMLDEYPIAKWNEINTIDCIVTFYQEHNRVPAQQEMDETGELPYYGMFKYKWKITYLEWLKKYIPLLHKTFFEERVYKRDYLSEFISEYKRLFPRNEADFDRRRNQEVCCKACYVKAAINVKSWSQLVKYCGLELFDSEGEKIANERAKIKSIRVINVDCGENLFFREYSKKLEREFAIMKD